MKPSELAKLAASYASFVRALGGDTSALDGCIELANASQDGSIAAFARRLKAMKADPSASIPEARYVRDTRDVLDLLHQVLIDAGAKSAAKDVGTIRDALSGLVTLTIPHVVSGIVASSIAKPNTPTLNEDVVLRYMRRLEEALGDDAGFKTVHSQLSSDPSVAVAELAALAKRFAFASVKSKAAALKKIQARHDALVTSRGKSAATAGRIAG